VGDRTLKAFCISHVKDVDGISSAALVVAAKGADFLLTDYGSVIEDLGKVPDGIDEFVLCDIGSDETSMDRFVEELGRLAGRCSVTYIDHHHIPESAKRRIRAKGVKFVHDTSECASMLTYRTLRNSLPQEASYLALYGAVTDYMDDSPMAKKLMERTDRQFVLACASLLSHAVSRKGDESGYPEMLVKELAGMKFPHRIDEVVKHAVDQMDTVVGLMEIVGRKGRKLRGLAYMDTTEHSTGNVAKLLIGAFGVRAGVSYREREKGWMEVSVRGTSDCRAHLGVAMGRISKRLGGSGGGHRRAAGGRVPAGRIGELLEALSRAV
jgi:single-stranded DNA-specific DHH superfamily exonuclease